MANHIKPTKEELAAEVQAAAAALDNPPVEPVAPVEPPVEPVEPKEPVEPVVEPPVEPVAPVEPPVEPVDYKDKFINSSREAQKIVAKNKVLNQAIDEAGEMPDPTSEQLQGEYPEWEDMTPTEQRLAKENLISKQFREKISAAREKGKQIEKWNEQVDQFIEDPKVLTDNPDLEGKTDEFRAFASEEANSGTPFKILIGAFLHETAKNKPAPKKGQMFETGNGGPNDNPQPKSDKLTVEEGRALRLTDYPKFKEFLKAGKIANE